MLPYWACVPLPCLGGVRGERTFPRAINAAIIAVLLRICPLVVARDKAPKRIKPDQNAPQYAGFAKPLPQTEQLNHAVERLTFGPKPDDIETIRQTGLKKWIDLQLHPERVPENPILIERLEPLASLRMSAREAYVHYPPPQMIAAVARGKATLPDDPELRAIVVRLADKYLEKKNGGLLGKQVEATQTQTQTPNDEADLDLKMKLSDILTPEQMEILKNGKPEEKRTLLASLPAGKRTDFVWSLRPAERQKLLNFAPVSLRRELMLSVNPQNVVAMDLTEGKLLRAIYSTDQLQELLHLLVIEKGHLLEPGQGTLGFLAAHQARPPRRRRPRCPP